MRKAGFEAEYHNNVPELIRTLHSIGYADSPDVHGYHCGCPTCDFVDGGIFRAQHDSSCGGEVISRPFTTWRDATEAMSALSICAQAVDAEPSLDSGVHVHVDVSDHNPWKLGHLVWEFARWEHVLDVLAAGRWPMARRWNTAVAPGLRGYLGDDYYGRDRFGNVDYACLDREMWNVDISSLNLQEVYAESRTLDRHTNLNTRTNHPTVEFRIWNATRSAWRMEMYVRISVLFASASFRRRLSEVAVTGDAEQDLDTFTDVVRRGATVCASFIDRQRQYLAERAQDAPPLLTV